MALRARQARVGLGIGALLLFVLAAAPARASQPYLVGLGDVLKVVVWAQASEGLPSANVRHDRSNTMRMLFMGDVGFEDF